MAGTCNFVGTGCSTVYLQKSTTIRVTGSTKIECTSSGDDAIYMNNSGTLNINGPGSLTLDSNGEGIEGNGSGTVNVAISNLYVNSSRASFKKLKTLNLNKSGGSYQYDKGLRYTTFVWLAPTGSSSYPHITDVTTINIQLGVKMPYNVSSTTLTSSSYYDKKFILSDEETNPSYTAVGDFIFSTVSYDGTTMARLMGPTMAYRANHGSTVDVPGTATVGGVSCPVYVNELALTDLTAAEEINFKPGVAYIGAYAFSRLPNLKTVSLPGTLTGMGRHLAHNSGPSSGTFTLYWHSVAPENVDCDSYAFNSMKTSTKRAYFPTASAASAASSALSGFTTAKASDPGDVFDYSAGAGYYVVSTPAWKSSSGEGEMAYIGSALTATLVQPNYYLYLASKRYNCTSVVANACRGNTSITTIDLSNSYLQTIGANAFSGCTKATTVTVGQGVTSMGSNVFSGCTALKTVNWNMTACPHFTESTRPFYGSNNISTATFGSNVTRIPAYLFYNESLTSVSTSAATIGDYAFYQNASLSSVTLGEGVKTIGKMAFYGAVGVNSLRVPTTVTSVGMSAFGYWSSLKSVSWYATNCADFTTSTAPFSDMNTVTSMTFGGVTRISAYLCYNLNKITSLTIPSSVTAIGSNAFSGCTGVTSVGWYPAAFSDFTETTRPFNGLTGITSITFGTNVTKIPAYLCYNMSKITSLTIPSSVTTIGGNAFSGCSGLTSLTIPAAVTTIGSNVFGGCTGLKTVNWNAASCGDFTETTRPFKGLVGITSINFGSNVTKIPAWLCNGLNGLTAISIPGSVKSIGGNAFRSCTALSSITSAIANPTTVTYGNGIFDGVNKQTCELHIPGGTLALYKATDPWSAFFNIIDPNAGTFEQGDVDGNGLVNGTDVTALYNWLLNGVTPNGDADVDGNGTINGTDVTALYNILLK